MKKVLFLLTIIFMFTTNVYAKSDVYSINMDIYFFGLVYFTLFQHRQVDLNNKDKLKQALERGIDVMRMTGHQIHTPAQLQYLRARIIKSIEIYQDYLLP